MSEILIEKNQMFLEWKKFQNRIFPPAERRKEWAQTPVRDWKNMPEKNRRHLSELNAFVQKILDSKEECISEIYDECPIDLKVLLVFRLERVSSFLEEYFRQYPAIRVPEDDSVLSFFRELMLQP
jgi:hypothetical protein